MKNDDLIDGGIDRIGTKIGIFGGTFDPVHNGHCALVRQFKQQCGLDSIIVIPAANPPHKLSQSLTDFEHRFNMLSLVFTDVQDVFLSRLEQFREGPSYTIDTLKQLTLAIDGKREWFIAVGEDTLAEIHTWKQYQAILDIACLVAFNRNVALDIPAISVVRQVFSNYSLANDQRSLSLSGVEKIRLLTMPAVDISSSGIRQSIANNADCSEQLPEAVSRYIADHHLYSS